MIKVEVLKKQEEIQQITILGHAMYDTYGKDIVCASVSTLVITTINNILLLNDQLIKTTEKKDGLIILVKQNNDITTKLLAYMLMCLDKIAKDYPKNIEIKCKEE